MAVPAAQLESMLAQWEADISLLDPRNFGRRIAVQDGLERLLEAASFERNLADRARALQSKLDSVGNELYASIRYQVQAGSCPEVFASILRDLATPPRGLAYDHLDDLVSGVLQFETPADQPRALAPDSVFYQPTPARHIFHLITAAAITEEDTLIDLGSGLGHVPLLVSIYTGATSIGIELDSTLIASAAECAASLNLSSVSFLTRNAIEADLSTGTVFYLYTPFTGPTLASVLDRLHTQATHRPIRICTFGPCTLTLAQQPWLLASSPPDAEQVTLFTPLP